MAEAIVMFIFISWLLVTLIVYWIKRNLYRRGDRDRDVISELEAMLKDRE